MPHVSSSGGDDLASSDEVKVYKDEGEEENRSSENLAEDKVVLVTETEEGKTSDGSRDGFDRGSKEGPSVNGDVKPHRPIWNPLISPYPYPNGATPTLSGLSPLTSLWPHYSSDRPFGSPPPAHMGIPPVHIDPKGWPRPLPIPGQFPHPFYPELSSPWAGPGGYPMATPGLRGPYPPLSSSPLSRFSPGLFPPHPGLPPGLPHHAAGLVSPGAKQELASLNADHPHHPRALEYGLLPGHGSPHSQHEQEPSKQRIKKPLNAFMLFMKEMRPKVIEECSLKESAAINQILGRKWHALDRAEQAKYYEMARKEKELHLQLYPGWSARDNYGTHSKNKKKRKAPGQGPGSGGSNHGSECGDYKSDHPHPQSYTSDSECVNNPKKCRARFGLDQQNQWCKPCRVTSNTLCNVKQEEEWDVENNIHRRKKKCIRFLEEGGVYSDEEEDNNNSRPVPSVSSCQSDPPDASPAQPPPNERHSPAPRSAHEPPSQPHVPLHSLYQPYDLFTSKPATLSRPPPMYDIKARPDGLRGPFDIKPNVEGMRGPFDIKPHPEGVRGPCDIKPLPDGMRGPETTPTHDRKPLAPANQRLSSVTPNMILAT